VKTHSVLCEVGSEFLLIILINIMCDVCCLSKKVKLNKKEECIRVTFMGDRSGELRVFGIEN
jgi:hypothetical protein